MKTQAMHENRTMRTADYAILILVLSVLTFSVLNALITFPYVFEKHKDYSGFAFEYSNVSEQARENSFVVPVSTTTPLGVAIENSKTIVTETAVRATSVSASLAAMAIVEAEEPLELESWMTDPAVWPADVKADPHPVNMEIIKEMMVEEPEAPLKLAPWMTDERCFPSPDTRVK